MRQLGEESGERDSRQDVMVPQGWWGNAEPVLSHLLCNSSPNGKSLYVAPQLPKEHPGHPAWRRGHVGERGQGAAPPTPHRHRHRRPPLPRNLTGWSHSSAKRAATGPSRGSEKGDVDLDHRFHLREPGFLGGPLSVETPRGGRVGKGQVVTCSHCPRSAEIKFPVTLHQIKQNPNNPPKWGAQVAQELTLKFKLLFF